MISYDEALSMVLAAGAARPLGSEAVTVSDISGRIAASELRAPMTHQPFDNASMDGFAIRAADWEAPLQVVERIAAGRAQPAAPLKAGQCHAIMTGAPMPAGADAVVPVENTELAGDQRIRITRPVQAGDFIRRAGGDYRAGDRVWARGAALEPEHVLAASTLGVARAEVVCAPRIALLSTGSEIVDELTAPLGPGQIYNASAPYLRARVGSAGGMLSTSTSVGEDVSHWERAVREGADKSDLVISTGAVSMGDHDFVPQRLLEMGAEILFHRVAIRPGKPILFARLPGGVPFLGLPGNPASSAAGWQFFARPLLGAMQSRLPDPHRYGVLRTAYRKGPVPLRFFMRARLFRSETGSTEVEILGHQPSFMVSPFVKSEAWAIVSEDTIELAAGAVVRISTAR